MAAYRESISSAFPRSRTSDSITILNTVRSLSLSLSINDDTESLSIKYQSIAIDRFPGRDD